jgi:mannose-1-phosphate guanylyltransferase
VKKIVPVILAGGIGERFWPLSRSSLPKQLLALTSRRTMIEETFSRTHALLSHGVVPLVITGKTIASRMKALLSRKWRYDLIVEPVGKNTAPAIALAAAWIETRYGRSIMAILPADHLIRPLNNFIKAVRHASFLADTLDHLIVFGVKPSRPETGYGYLLLGKERGTDSTVKSYAISRFIEKPDAAAAAKYCHSARYRWNSGMFVWKTDVLLKEVKSHLPALYSLVREAARSRFSKKAIARFYQAAQKESIDYGIMERSTRVSAVVGQFHWDDIGSWESLFRVKGKDRAGTTVVGKRIFTQECRNSIIINRSSAAVAVVGCSGLAVIATGDALLVIPASKLPDLKKFLGNIKKSGKFPSRLF